MPPLDASIAMELNPAVVMPMIDILLGEPGTPPTVTDHNLTEIEMNIIEGVIRLAMRDLRDAWRPIEEYLSPRLARTMLPRPGRATRTAVGKELTSREHEILRLVARGFATSEISARLGVSAKTVDSHRRNIREKLGLESARDLVRYAVRWAEGEESPGSPS